MEMYQRSVTEIHVYRFLCYFDKNAAFYIARIHTGYQETTIATGNNRPILIPCRLFSVVVEITE